MQAMAGAWEQQTMVGDCSSACLHPSRWGLQPTPPGSHRVLCHPTPACSGPAVCSEVDQAAQSHRSSAVDSLGVTLGPLVQWHHTHPGLTWGRPLPAVFSYGPCPLSCSSGSPGPTLNQVGYLLASPAGSREGTRPLSHVAAGVSLVSLSFHDANCLGKQLSRFLAKPFKR